MLTNDLFNQDFINYEYIMINPYTTLLVTNYLKDNNLYKRTEGFIIYTKNDEKILFFNNSSYIPEDIKNVFHLDTLLKKHNDIKLNDIIIEYVSYNNSLIDTVFMCHYEGLFLKQDLSKITSKDDLMKFIARLHNFIITVYEIYKNLDDKTRKKTTLFIQNFGFTDKQLSICKKFDINIYNSYNPTELEINQLKNIIKNKSIVFKYNLFSIKYGKIFINNIMVNENIFIKFMNCIGLYDTFINKYEYKTLTES